MHIQHENLSKVKDSLLADLHIAESILAINPTSAQGLQFKRAILESFTTEPVTLTRAAVILHQASTVAKHDQSVKHMFESTLAKVNQNRYKFDLLTSLEQLNEAKLTEYQKNAVKKLDENIHKTGRRFVSHLVENQLIYSQLGQGVVRILTEAKSRVLSEAKHLVTTDISIFNPVSVTEKDAAGSIVFRIENSILCLANGSDLSICTASENFVNISNLIEANATYDIDNKSFIVKLKDSTCTISDDNVTVDGVTYKFDAFLEVCMTGDHISRWSMDGCSTAIAIIKNWDTIVELDSMYQFSNTQGDVGFIACLPKADGKMSYYTAICKSVRWPVGLTAVDSVSALIEFANVCFATDISNMAFIQKCIETEFETVATAALDLKTVEEKLLKLNQKREQVVLESQSAKTKDALAIYNDVLADIDNELARIREKLKTRI